MRRDAVVAFVFLILVRMLSEQERSSKDLQLQQERCSNDPGHHPAIFVVLYRTGTGKMTRGQRKHHVSKKVARVLSCSRQAPTLNLNTNANRCVRYYTT